MRLEALDVSHCFAELRVLDGVSLRVEEGEVLGIIGPSGCGKSTLLEILGGLLDPSAGRVVLAGDPPDGCLNPLTFVFQDFALLPWRSVERNVSLALEGVGLGTAEKDLRVRQALDRTGLLDFSDAYPRQLSGGMRQRVGIARAMVVRPAVLLMDEPLSALDAQTREVLKEDLLELWRDTKCTTAYVTHNLSEVVGLADRVAVLSRRPARVREVIEVPVGRDDRRREDPVLLELQSYLWNLLSSEARDVLAEPQP